MCRALGRWPYRNPPETATLAQVLLYQAALEELNRPRGQTPPPGRPPKRLRGEDWAAIKRKVSG